MRSSNSIRTPIQIMLILSATLVVACSDPVSVDRSLLRPKEGTALSTPDGQNAPAPTFAIWMPVYPYGSTTSAAYGINDFGEMAGYSDYLVRGRPNLPTPPPRCRVPMAAVLFRGGATDLIHENIGRQLSIDPCDFESVATDMGNDGTVVGVIDRTRLLGPNAYSGFVWSKTRGFVQVTAPGPTFLTGVNNRGEAVGFYYATGFGYGMLDS